MSRHVWSTLAEPALPNIVILNRKSIIFNEIFINFNGIFITFHRAHRYKRLSTEFVFKLMDFVFR